MTQKNMTDKTSMLAAQASEVCIRHHIPNADTEHICSELNALTEADLMGTEWTASYDHGDEMFLLCGSDNVIHYFANIAFHDGLVSYWAMDNGIVDGAKREEDVSEDMPYYPGIVRDLMARWTRYRVSICEEFFCQTLRDTGREHVEDVINGLRKIGFFTSSASSNAHFAFEGGLLIHSLNVYSIACDIAQSMRSLQPRLDIRQDSIAIAALLHDVCKATRYMRQTDGTYTKTYSLLPVGHGEKSVIMILRMGLDLTDEEILAIRYHMGAFQLQLLNDETNKDYLAATRGCPLVNIIHTADTLAALIIEGAPLPT